MSTMSRSKENRNYEALQQFLCQNEEANGEFNDATGLTPPRLIYHVAQDNKMDPIELLTLVNSSAFTRDDEILFMHYCAWCNHWLLDYPSTVRSTVQITDDQKRDGHDQLSTGMCETCCFDQFGYVLNSDGETVNRTATRRHRQLTANDKWARAAIDLREVDRDER